MSRNEFPLYHCFHVNINQTNQRTWKFRREYKNYSRSFSSVRRSPMRSGIEMYAINLILLLCIPIHLVAGSCLSTAATPVTQAPVVRAGCYLLREHNEFRRQVAMGMVHRQPAAKNLGPLVGFLPSVCETFHINQPETIKIPDRSLVILE